MGNSSTNWIFGTAIMDKLKLQSPDLVQENIANIRKFFPDCVTEAGDEETGKCRLAVDFDRLRQHLSDHVVEGQQERYQLDWPGKREALLAANAPIAKTMRPFQEESVNFGATKNLFIEGDNLDALKLLQKSYLGCVKMIYIDPPYNTGKDFIYKDNFSDSINSFLEKSLQMDQEKNKLIANPEINGRFHSNWLSMIYSRLRLARSLLRKDGVAFISIDDGEVHNLRKVADDVFGERNFVANIVWEKKYAPANDAKWLSDNHDHILLYAKDKDIWRPKALPRSEKQNKRYTNRDNDPRGPWKSGDLSVKTYTEKNDYPITTPSGRIVKPPHGRCWLYPEETLKRMISENRIWFGKNKSNVPSIKRFLSEVKKGVVPLTIWKHDEVGHNQDGRQQLKKLFDDRGYFDSPKPVSLIRRMLYLSDIKEHDIAMDFFGGSGTTAHAVMEMNAEDGVERKFILVQFPESIDEATEAGKSGFANVADIAKERIRRAGREILANDHHSNWSRDVGFRVLKIDTSNVKDAFYYPDKLAQKDFLDMIDNVKEDRTGEDLLFQVLIDWGMDLSLPIRCDTVQSKTVFFVNESELIACFDTGVTEDLAKDLAQRTPSRMIFRDSGFISDATKINVEQIFRQLSPATEIKVI